MFSGKQTLISICSTAFTVKLHLLAHMYIHKCKNNNNKSSKVVL